MKIYLQYPWKFFPDSPYYKYLIQNPPKNIEYLNVEKQKGVITKSKKLSTSHKLKINIRRLIDWSRLPLINAHFTRSEEDYDLIHCAHCLSKNKEPWVADFEGTWQFYLGNENPSANKRIRKILLRDNCKKILAWTEQVKEEILKRFPEINDKIEVIYPAIPISKVKKKKHNKINLLFVGRYFYRKGGLHALEAIDRLTKKYENVRGIIVSEVPKEIKEKYSNLKIKFYNLMSQEELFKICAISDIFIYPGYTDSLGFSILESMSFGIPVISVKGFARKELIEDGRTGFVIDLGREIKKREGDEHKEDIVRKLVKKTGQLIRDKRLRDKMSKNCIELIKNGKFSIKERNKKLEEIYKNAI